MKKYLLTTVLTSILMAGCVSDEIDKEVDNRLPLQFDAPVLSTQSRAEFTGEIGGVVYPTNESFKVWCINYTGSFNGWANSTNVSNYFDAAGEVASHENSYWETETDHFWPSAGHNLAFAAVSPAVINTGASVSCTATGITITDFQVEEESDKQYDLMYSDRVVDRNRSNNGSTHVSLNFKHALSSVVFSAEKSNNDTRTYTITDLKLKGTFDVQGTFNQAINETQATPETQYSEGDDPSWTPVDGTEVKTYYPSFTNFQVSSTPTLFTEGASAILMIPQELPYDAVVLVSYTVKTTENVVTTHTDVECKLADFTPIETEFTTPTKWEIGKRYVYRISFGEASKIYFQPAVTQWEKGGTYKFTI